jgi:hypothetical protein
MATYGYEQGGNLNGQQLGGVELPGEGFAPAWGSEWETSKYLQNLAGAIGRPIAGQSVEGFGRAGSAALSGLLGRGRMAGEHARQRRATAGGLRRAGITGGAARAASGQLAGQQAEQLSRMDMARSAALGNLAQQFAGTALGAGKFAMSPFESERQWQEQRAAARRQRHSDRGGGGLGGPLGSLLGAGLGYMAPGIGAGIGTGIGGYLGDLIGGTTPTG